MIKLGLAKGAANLLDRIAITGRSGPLLRQGTYLSLLLNPVHNFNTTLSWLTDELLQRHTLPPPVPEPRLRSGLPRWAVGSALGLAVAVGRGLIWRAIAPAQFERFWQPTGIPARIDQVYEQES